MVNGVSANSNSSSESTTPDWDNRYEKATRRRSIDVGAPTPKTTTTADARETDPVQENQKEMPSGDAIKNSIFCSVPLNKIPQVVLVNNASPTPAKVDEGVAKASKPSSRKLLCLYCERTFVSGNLRQKHVERCHSEKQNRRLSSRKLQSQFTTTACVYCDQLPAEHTLNQLFVHLVTKHSDKYFACLPCEDRFLNVAGLNDHNSLVHPVVHKEITKQPASLSPDVTLEKLDLDEADANSEEPSVKITRSVAKSQLKAKHKSSKELQNKKVSVKASKIALKRSKRIQSKAVKTTEKKKKKETNITESATEKPKKTPSVNPYPEFDRYYRVKKITDHSIDNLKISSLTFDDVFDKAFFSRIKCNIQDNLLHHLDGKLFKNEESESRISNFEKNTPGPPEANSSTSETFGCEVSLNAIAPITSILTPLLGEDPETQIEYGSKPSKKKLQPRQDPVRHKYVTRRKYQASILEHKENRDLSKLDMWTQLVIKERQQKVVDSTKSEKEIQEYETGNEYKIQLQKNELNRILDRRGPFEDLKEESSKKAALDKLNSSSNNVISEESFNEVREVMDNILDEVFRIVSDNNIVDILEDSVKIKEEIEELKGANESIPLPDYLKLRRTSSLPNQNDMIDRSDKIALICSSQETENFELPTNTIRDKNEIVELSGEWARSRLYICTACGFKLPNMKLLLDHKSFYHQNVWTQHYELVGNQGELYRHLCIPGLGKVGEIEDRVSCKMWKRSDARSCSKCGKVCNQLGELHRHILECGGDWTWMLARKKCKYRPFGSRKKRKGLVKRIHSHSQKTEPTEKKIYKKTYNGPRQRPSDADTIQRMLANLPPKRASRKIMCLKDGFNPRRNLAPAFNNTNMVKKLKCGKAILKKPTTVDNTPKPKSGSKDHANASNRRTLRSISKVLSSRILDTNSTLRVKRMIKNFNRRVTRQNAKVNTKSDLISEEIVESTNKENTLVEEPKDKVASLNHMTSDKVVSDKLTIKNFFPVSKRKTLGKIVKGKLNKKDSSKNINIYSSENVPKNHNLNKTKTSSKVTKKAIKKLINICTNKSKSQLLSKDITLSTVKEIASIKKVKPKAATKKRSKIINKKKVNIEPPKIFLNDNLIQETAEAPEGPFLGAGLNEKEKLRIVLAQSAEERENTPSIPASVPLVMVTSTLPSEEPLIPENIFNLDYNSESLLQAKNNEDNSAVLMTQTSIPESSNSYEPKEEIKKHPTQKDVSTQVTLTVETTSRTDKGLSPSISPLISPSGLSPRAKGKMKKPNKGLNDCIAMLTKKAFDESLKIDYSNIKNPAVREKDCILKIPVIETGCSEDEVLDLSKPKQSESQGSKLDERVCTDDLESQKLNIDLPSNEIQKISYNILDKKQRKISSVDRTIEDVVENKIIPASKEFANILEKPILKIPNIKDWISVNNEVEKTLTDTQKSPLKPLNKSSIDDVIEEVVRGNFTKKTEIEKSSGLFNDSKLLSSNNTIRKPNNDLLVFNNVNHFASLNSLSNYLANAKKGPKKKSKKGASKVPSSLLDILPIEVNASTPEPIQNTESSLSNFFHEAEKFISQKNSINQITNSEKNTSSLQEVFNIPVETNLNKNGLNEEDKEKIKLPNLIETIPDKEDLTPETAQIEEKHEFLINKLVEEKTNLLINNENFQKDISTNLCDEEKKLTEISLDDTPANICDVTEIESPQEMSNTSNAEEISLDLINQQNNKTKSSKKANVSNRRIAKTKPQKNKANKLKSNKLEPPIDETIKLSDVSLDEQNISNIEPPNTDKINESIVTETEDQKSLETQNDNKNHQLEDIQENKFVEEIPRDSADLTPADFSNEITKDKEEINLEVDNESKISECAPNLVTSNLNEKLETCLNDFKTFSESPSIINSSNNTADCKEECEEIFVNDKSIDEKETVLITSPNTPEIINEQLQPSKKPGKLGRKRKNVKGTVKNKSVPKDIQIEPKEENKPELEKIENSNENSVVESKKSPKNKTVLPSDDEDELPLVVFKAKLSNSDSNEGKNKSEIKIIPTDEDEENLNNIIEKNREKSKNPKDVIKENLDNTNLNAGSEIKKISGNKNQDNSDNVIDEPKSKESIEISSQIKNSNTPSDTISAVIPTKSKRGRKPKNKNKIINQNTIEPSVKASLEDNPNKPTIEESTHDNLNQEINKSVTECTTLLPTVSEIENLENNEKIDESSKIDSKLSKTTEEYVIKNHILNKSTLENGKKSRGRKAKNGKRLKRKTKLILKFSKKILNNSVLPLDHEPVLENDAITKNNHVEEIKLNDDLKTFSVEKESDDSLKQIIKVVNSNTKETKALDNIDSFFMTQQKLFKKRMEKKSLKIKKEKEKTVQYKWHLKEPKLKILNTVKFGHSNKTPNVDNAQIDTVVLKNETNKLVEKTINSPLSVHSNKEEKISTEANKEIEINTAIPNEIKPSENVNGTDMEQIKDVDLASNIKIVKKKYHNLRTKDGKFASKLSKHHNKREKRRKLSKKSKKVAVRNILNNETVNCNSPIVDIDEQNESNMENKEPEIAQPEIKENVEFYKQSETVETPLLNKDIDNQLLLKNGSSPSVLNIFPYITENSTEKRNIFAADLLGDKKRGAKVKAIVAIKGSLEHVPNSLIKPESDNSSKKGKTRKLKNVLETHSIFEDGTNTDTTNIELQNNSQDSMNFTLNKNTEILAEKIIEPEIPTKNINDSNLSYKSQFNTEQEKTIIKNSNVDIETVLSSFVKDLIPNSQSCMDNENINENFEPETNNYVIENKMDEIYLNEPELLNNSMKKISKKKNPSNTKKKSKKKAPKTETDIAVSNLINSNHIDSEENLNESIDDIFEDIANEIKNEYKKTLENEEVSKFILSEKNKFEDTLNNSKCVENEFLSNSSQLHQEISSLNANDLPKSPAKKTKSNKNKIISDDITNDLSTLMDTGISKSSELDFDSNKNSNNDIGLNKSHSFNAQYNAISMGNNDATSNISDQKVETLNKTLKIQSTKLTEKCLKNHISQEVNNELNNTEQNLSDPDDLDDKPLKLLIQENKLKSKKSLKNKFDEDISKPLSPLKLTLNSPSKNVEESHNKSLNIYDFEEENLNINLNEISQSNEKIKNSTKKKINKQTVGYINSSKNTEKSYVDDISENNKKEDHDSELNTKNKRNNKNKQISDGLVDNEVPDLIVKKPSRAAKCKALENIQDLVKLQDNDFILETKPKNSEHLEGSSKLQSQKVQTKIEKVAEKTKTCEEMFDELKSKDSMEETELNKTTKKCTDSEKINNETNKKIQKELLENQNLNNCEQYQPKTEVLVEKLENKDNQNIQELKVDIDDPDDKIEHEKKQHKRKTEENNQNDKIEQFDELEDQAKRKTRRTCKVKSYNENDLAIFIPDEIEPLKKSEKKKSKSIPHDEKLIIEKLLQEKENSLNIKINEDDSELFKPSSNDGEKLTKIYSNNESVIDDISNSISNDLDHAFNSILEKSKAVIAKNFNKSKYKSSFAFSNLDNSKTLSNEPLTNSQSTSDSNNEGKSDFSAFNKSIQSNDSNLEIDTQTSQASKEKYFCHVCNKAFKRSDNLTKHKRTLTHISKLSEIEAKSLAEKDKVIVHNYSEISEKSKSMVSENSISLDRDDKTSIDAQDSIMSYPATPGRNETIKLEEIINGVLDKSNLCNEFNNIESLNMSPKSKPLENKRYKSLGERKSFESDQTVSSVSDNISVIKSNYDSNFNDAHFSSNAGSMLEKQISLLQNIIGGSDIDIEENVSRESFSDISRGSPMSLESTRNDDYRSIIYTNDERNDEKVNSDKDFIKPSQVDDLSEDSINIKNNDDAKARKVLNRDEELFLECCSLLKSGSEISNFSKKSKKELVLSTMENHSNKQEWLNDYQNLSKKSDKYSDDSRIPTPLGDSFGDDISNSDTVSSNWNDVRHNIQDNILDKSLNFSSKIIMDRESSLSEKNEDSILSNSEQDLLIDSLSKMPTKGALKTFEGLKVSIPTEDLNLEEVLNHSPSNKKTENNKTRKEFLSPKFTPKCSRKSKPIKNKSQLNGKFGFKIGKSQLGTQKSLESSDDDNLKLPDVYDFEETQDNSDVFIKPDFKTFRTTKSGDDLKSFELEASLEETSPVTSLSSASTLSAIINSKSKSNECITKKKHMIMGRIFKNAVKSKLETDIKDIPLLDHQEMIENYVLSCSPKYEEEFKKPKMTQEEMNFLFDQLLDKPAHDLEEHANKTDSKQTNPRKRLKVRTKKRQRTKSDSTDDEFGLNKISKRRPYRKNTKTVDNSINLEQELKECIGVASRKSQRKCTSGKQNVLVEYWSSDESAFEAFLENHLQEMSNKNNAIKSVQEQVIDTAKPEIIEEKEEILNKKGLKRKNKTSNKPEEKKSKDNLKEDHSKDKEEQISSNRRKRVAANPLYHWSSSSEDEEQGLIEVKPLRDDAEEDEEDRPIQHGWIVGDSPKKLVTMLAQAKGKKIDVDGVKEQGKKRNGNS